jgi:molecular chaperone GrpE
MKKDYKKRSRNINRTIKITDLDAEEKQKQSSGNKKPNASKEKDKEKPFVVEPKKEDAFEAMEEKSKAAEEAQARATETVETPEAVETAESVPEVETVSGEVEGEAKAEASEGKEKKRGLFGDDDETDAALTKKDEQIAELQDQQKRLMAEFDNFRKRTEKEKSSMYEIGAKSILEKILPIVDNFERGLASISEEEKQSGFANGMDLVYKQLLKMLEDVGVKPIEAVGQPFDPNFHNAVMHVEDENLGENVVAQEFQKGYMYRDSVLRHSMVQVAN